VSGGSALRLRKKRPWAVVTNDIVSLLLFFFLFRSLDANQIQFHLPVRITIEKTANASREIQDFRLMINGVGREILGVKRRQKSLALKPDLGREFILSFRLLKYGSAIEKELATLITEILDTSDSLYLLTPIRLCRLEVSANKGSLLRQIRELLENDCRVFMKERMTAEAKLRGLLERLDSVLGDDPQDVGAYKETSLFLNVFPEEFMSHQIRFLLPDPKRYEQVLGRFGFGEGERWWIDFEQHQDAGLYQKIQAIIKKMDLYISLLSIGHQNLALVLSAGLTRLENTLSLGDSFPSAELIGVFSAYGVNYGFVSMKNDAFQESNFAEAPFLNLEALYSKVATASGGVAVYAGMDETGVTEIAKHVDEYYELAFGWDDRIEDIRIQVLLNGQTNGLRYAGFLTKDQVNSRVQFYSREKIRIDDVSVSAGRLSFIVDRFERKKEKDCGLLRIRVRLQNDRSQGVYDEENTLRATKERVVVSFPFPEELKGAFQLSITACDIVANRLAIEQRQIDLK